MPVPRAASGAPRGGSALQADAALCAFGSAKLLIFMLKQLFVWRENAASEPCQACFLYVVCIAPQVFVHTLRRMCKTKRNEDVFRWVCKQGFFCRQTTLVLPVNKACLHYKEGFFLSCGICFWKRPAHGSAHKWHCRVRTSALGAAARLGATKKNGRAALATRLHCVFTSFSVFYSLRRYRLYGCLNIMVLPQCLSFCIVVTLIMFCYKDED